MARLPPYVPGVLAHWPPWMLSGNILLYQFKRGAAAFGSSRQIYTFVGQYPSTYAGSLPAIEGME